MTIKRKIIRGGKPDVIAWDRNWIHRDDHQRGTVAIRLTLDDCSPDPAEPRSEFFRRFSRSPDA